MAEETDTKAHEDAETAAFEAEEQKSPKTIAKDYMIPMSDSALKEWKDKEGFAEYCSQVATGLYPTLAKQLLSGLTTKVLLDPYVQTAKKILGADTEANWDDPMWQKALSGGADPKTGQPTVMPLADFMALLKSDPSSGFDKTEEGSAVAGQAIGQLQDNQHAWDGTPEHKAHLMGKIAQGTPPGGVDPAELGGQ